MEMPRRLISQIGRSTEIRIPFDIKTKPGDRLNEHRKKEAQLREEEDHLITQAIRRRYIDSIAKFIELPETKSLLPAEERIRWRVVMDTLEESLNKY